MSSSCVGASSIGRLNLSADKQKRLLRRLEGRLWLGADEMAAVCQVHPRTYRDWRRGKYKISSRAIEQLCTRVGFELPKVDMLPDFWSTREAGRLGALTRYRLYGNPGTLEGRRKAGKLLVEWIRNNPEAAKLGGAAVVKEIKHPPLSPLLAEFVGTLIGDGSIRSRFQVAVTFDRSKDQEYAEWLSSVIKRLFGLGSFQVPKKGTLGCDLVVSSVKLVRFLEKVAGLRPGDKLRNGLDIPPWIWERRSYQVSCLRGLMDTDGGPFIHRYQVNGKWYVYPKLAFCSMSEQLRQSVFRLFAGLGFHPRSAKNHQVFIDRVHDAKRFYQLVGSRHKRHLDLIRNHEQRINRIRRGV